MGAGELGVAVVGDEVGGRVGDVVGIGVNVGAGVLVGANVVGERDGEGVIGLGCAQALRRHPVALGHCIAAPAPSVYFRLVLEYLVQSMSEEQSRLQKHVQHF